MSHFRMFRRLLMCSVGAFVLLGAAASTAYASHFRYTTLDYKPILDAQGNPTGTVEFHITEAWRRSAFGSLITGQTFSPSGFNFGDGSSMGLTLTITSYSSTDDWIVGTQTIQHHYSSAGPFTAFDTSCCRIGNINNGGGGSWYFDIVVRPYSMNSSPTSSLPPIVNVPAGTNATFFVPASDVNRDTLTYRIATDSGVPAVPNLSINAATGQVTWNNASLNRTNFWSVQFIIEDHDAAGAVLSRIRVDVLLKIVTPSGLPPTLLINSSPASATYSITPGTALSFPVKGIDNTGIPGDAVTLNVSGLPAGANQNPTLPVSAAGSVESTFTWTPTAANGGSHTITFSATDGAGQATLNSAIIFVEVNKPPTITCPQPVTTQYNVAAPLAVIVSDLNGDALTVTWELDGVGIRTDNTPGGASATTLTATQTWGAVGTHTVSLAVTDPKNASASCSATVTVEKADQTINFGSMADRIYGDPSFTASATATSNLAVSFSIVSGPATLSGGNVIALLESGTVTVRASQAGDDNYNAAPHVDQAFTVGRAALTVRADDQSRGYGDSTPALTGSVTGVVNNDSITATYATAASVTSGVGNYAIVPSLVDPSARLSNYTVTIVDGTLTIMPASIAVTADDASRIYGAANPAFTGVISGIKNGDAIVATYTTSATPASPVGSYAIVPSLTGAALANYTPPVVHDGTLTVTKADLTVTGDNASRLYGDPNPVLTGSIVGVVNNDAITASYSTDASLTSPVASYPIVPSLADPAGRLSNYKVSIVSGQLTILPASISVMADHATRLYGGENPAFTGVVTGIKNGDAIVAAYTTSATPASPVGSYDIVPALSGSALANYEAPVIHNGTLSITKASLTVIADDKSRIYGDPNPSLTGSIVGLVNGDQMTASYATEAAAASAVGSYPIVPSLVDPASRLANYLVTTTNGTLTVTPASISVAAHDAARSYGSANPELTGEITGIKNGDAIVASYSTAAMASSPVGSYPIVPALSGAALVNYAAPAIHNGTLTITKAAIAVKADDQHRLYGSANPPLTGILTGVVNGDPIIAAYSTSATTASAVGSYPIHPSLDDPSGRLANYDVHMTDGLLDVMPAPLTITADDAVREFGTPNPAFTVHFSGFQNSDTSASLSGALTFATPAASNSLPGAYPIVPSGVSSANYAIAFVAGTLTVRDTTPPGVSVPANRTLEATGPSGAVGTFAASALDAVDGSTPASCTPGSGSTFPFGTTSVTCSSTDAHGNTGSSSFTITVRDTTAPAIASVTPSAGSLWPPNHKMVAETIAVLASDAGDAAPVCRIASVASNEPVGADGDWVITGALSLNLRAERLGGGAGRVYTIGVKCVDNSGNTSSKTTMVSVPHDQGK